MGAKNKEDYYRLKRLGRCVSCCKPNDRAPKVLCLPCSKRQTAKVEAYRKRVAAKQYKEVACILSHRRKVEAEVEGDKDSIFTDDEFMTEVLEVDCKEKEEVIDWNKVFTDD